MQHAYRIVVASSPELLPQGGDLWDSGVVESTAASVLYAGQPLVAGLRCYWAVSVWTSKGEGQASEPSFWEMGPLSEQDWDGTWLAAESDADQLARQVPPIWLAGEIGPDASREFNVTWVITQAGPVRLIVATKGVLQRIAVDGKVLPVEPWSVIAFGGPPAYTFDLKLEAGPHEITAVVAQRPHPLSLSEVAIAAHLTDSVVPSIDLSADRWQTRAGQDAAWRPAASAAEQTDFPWPPGPARLLRRTFDVPAGLVRACVHVAALGGCVLRLNGTRVGDAELQGEPADYRVHVPYRTYDVTAQLTEGKNAIGALIGDGFYASYLAPTGRYSFGAAPRRLRIALVMQFADGSTRQVTGDHDWTGRSAHLLRSEIYAGEHWDLRQEPIGWDSPDFDDADWDPVGAAEAPAGPLVAALAPPVRAIVSVAPVSLRLVGTSRYLIDFGQNFAGRVRVRISGEAGQTITVRHSEILDDEGELDVSNLRIANATDTYVLRDDQTTVVEPSFTYHGFRYAEVTGPAQLNMTDVVGVVLSSDLPQTGRFETSDPIIQRLWENTLWSQRSNFVGIPTDCPQRDERLGWTGDAQVFWDTASYNMDVAAFTRSFAREMRGAQEVNGAFPMWAPQAALWHPLAGSPLPGWADAGVELPYVAYLHTADRTIVDENWDAMTAYLDGILASNPDGVWRNGRGLDLGDWLSFDAVEPMDETTPRDLIGTAMLARSLDRMAVMANWTDRHAEAARWRNEADTVAAAFGRTFVQDDGTVGNGSHTSYILALRLGLVPELLREKAGALLAANVRSRGTMLTTGFLGTPLALDALADVGEVELAYSLLLRREYPSWGYMIERGATTIWERWNGDTADIAMNSFNHYALGAVCAFLYRRVAGIEPLEPGFARFSIAPLTDARLTSASGGYDSVRGRIESSWERDSDQTVHTLRIPVGSEAEVRLPGRVIDTTTLAYDRATGVSTGLLGSGTYHFKTRVS
ncbi:alpha-L-rhamnosidase [Sphingomonas sp. PP-F2F-A104-K0414]|uniref:alpha-L-rhamnosidase n=1 Tax=Sphingomonas sp. PP-F2F-A104-K0414 TaxID=2135661 RepID=UPI0014054BAB|nr:alpha-L-rhamnosidase [Sphingomonas sp. PP-F2F-A104-K0414]